MLTYRSLFALGFALGFFHATILDTFLKHCTVAPTCLKPSGFDLTRRLLFNSNTRSKVHTKKLILGITSARITALGLVAMPALIDPSLAGPTDAQRKVLFFTDPDTALLLGINTNSLAIEPSDSVRLDHAELPARYAGASFDGHDYLESVFDTSGTRVFERNISDVNTIMFVLSKQGALKLELIDQNYQIDSDAILVAIQGGAADIIMDKILDAGVADELPRRQAAAFFAGEIFDSVPAVSAVRPNGHDADTAVA